MSFLCSSLSCNLFGVLVALCIGIITYLKWSQSYWKRRNLPYLQSNSLYEAIKDSFFRSETLGVWFKQSYDDLKKKGVKHGGIYNFFSPVYFPVDPDYVKNIMQNDFQYFMDRGEYYNEKDDPLSAHLFSLEGQKWRNLRAKLTPTFTSGKMKMMFETLVQCSDPLKDVMDELTEKNQKIDIKELVARYTTDVIGSCAFGLDCNSFKSPNAEFRQCGKEIINITGFRLTLALFANSCHAIGSLFNIRVFPKTAADFFFKVVQDTVNYRKANNVRRNDILQLLTEIKTSSVDSQSGQTEGSALTIEEIAAQCTIFFIAGFETSSSTLTFCLYELGKNPVIQQKVRDEISAVLSKFDGKISYDSMSELKYMTQVLEETMRKYPILPLLTRICCKDYPVPNTDVVIEKGTSVFISNYGLQYDPDYYPNPEKFDPERFSEENKRGRHQFVYMPFGEGPRVCIGLRFGIMEMKVCLTVLLKNYIFSLNPSTPDKLTFNTGNFLLEANEPICLDSKPVNEAI